MLTTKLPCCICWISVLLYTLKSWKFCSILYFHSRLFISCSVTLFWHFKMHLNCNLVSRDLVTVPKTFIPQWTFYIILIRNTFNRIESKPESSISVKSSELLCCLAAYIGNFLNKEDSKMIYYSVKFFTKQSASHHLN